MTRDGFTLLAVGFNGKTALAFKVRYIEEFNRMEAQLKAPQAPQLPNFMDPGEAAIAWGEQFKTRQGLRLLFDFVLYARCLGVERDAAHAGGPP